jgi:hypothetical protein
MGYQRGFLSFSLSAFRLWGGNLVQLRRQRHGDPYLENKDAKRRDVSDGGNAGLVKTTRGPGNNPADD